MAPRVIGYTFVALLVFPITINSFQASNQQTTNSSEIPGEILVEFKQDTPLFRRQAALARHRAQSLRRFDALNAHQARLAPGSRASDVLAALKADPDVVAVQPNFTRQVTELAAPNDPFWQNGSLWGMDRIAADDVWASITTGNGTVVIADIDTGVNYNHPDLAGNMWRNPGEIAGNGFDDDGNGYADDVFGIDTHNQDSDPMDDHGHGTHVAGTIAASGNNGEGVTGVNWNAKILACKFIGSGGTGSDGGAIGCLNYLIALKNRGVNIRVTSNSWGSDRSGSEATVLRSAFDRADDVGILHACAAGNSGRNADAAPFDPAGFSLNSIVSVAASETDDSRAGFSNYGATTVDLAAPGVNILSTVGDTYGYKSGTSMATPHVAGAAALLSSLDSGLSLDSLKFLLMQNVDVMPQWFGVVASNGRLNVFRAASAISPAPPPPPSEPPPSEPPPPPPPTGGRVNVALAASGAAAVASSVHSGGYAPGGAINGDRRGSNWGSGGGWNDGTTGWPDWIEIDFAGTETIDEIDVFTVQDNYLSPVDPTPTMTALLYGLRDFSVQYWNGSTWADVPGGVVTGNNLVWRQFTFSPLTTSKIRVYVTSALNFWSRVTEVEAYRSSTSSPSPPPPDSGRANFALAANGATVTASSTYGSSYSPAGAINGDRKGEAWGISGGWNDATAQAFPDWLEVSFAGTANIDEVNVFSVQDAFWAPAEPTSTMTFSSYGLRNFEIHYWTGSGWLPVAGAAVANNSLVWRQFTFSPVATSKIRVLITAAADTWSRVTEVEAWGGGSASPPPPGSRANVALATNGGIATSSSNYSNGYAPAGAINGDRSGSSWGSGGGWNDGTAGSWPDWVEVSFNGSYTINEINVFSVQDNYQSPSQPSAGMTFTQYGLRDFEVQYWNGSSWVTIPAGSVSGNNLVWRQFTFTPVTTSKIRILVHSGLNTWSRIAEVEAFTSGG